VLAARLIGKIQSVGHLIIINADGVKHECVRTGEPRVTIRLHDRSLHWKLALYPSLVIGEAYVDGTLTIEDGTLRDFLTILLHSEMAFGNGPATRFVTPLKHWFYRREIVNKVGDAERNVKHHYDLSSSLYELFLDPDRQYSCAYFRSLDDDLATAQLQKKQHLAAKLLLEPGQRVLDIGCGWGGLALYLAKTFGVHVTGLTLSDEQFRMARQRARAEGLSQLVKFKKIDYRNETGTYDRIVSVGMFEHVGEPQFEEFFSHLKRLLKDDGIATLHTIGRHYPPSPINVWIRRYIFPGAYIPSLSQIVPILEREDIWLNDLENLRLHYAETLKAWDANFQRQRTRVAEIYDERFCRMWEFYLQSAELGFRISGLTVFQMQLSKKIGSVPMTRDYQTETEHELRSRHRRGDGEIRIPAE
jgi:cyclopropane-fatty-acyl-phospholipid synthase